MEQLHRPVSLSEAAFLVIEDRAEMVDREAERHELLRTPTDFWKRSKMFFRIRKNGRNRILWYYFANLDGHHHDIPLPEDDGEQRFEAVLQLIAQKTIAVR